MNKLFTLNLEHRFAGKNFAALQIFPNEYCRIIRLGNYNEGKDKLETEALLACSRPTILHQWKAKNLVTKKEEVQMLTPDQLKMLQPIRDGLASGKLKVVNTRIVEVT